MQLPFYGNIFLSKQISSFSTTIRSIVTTHEHIKNQEEVIKNFLKTATLHLLSEYEGEGPDNNEGEEYYGTQR